MRYKVTVKLEFHTDAISPINAKLELLDKLYKVKQSTRANQTMENVEVKVEELKF